MFTFVVAAGVSWFCIKVAILVHALKEKDVTSSERMFPILLSYRESREHPDCPKEVPWALVEPCRVRAQKNHSQTLERLAERGGLSPAELRCALENKELRHYFPLSSYDAKRAAEDIVWLCDLVKRGGGGER